MLQPDLIMDIFDQSQAEVKPKGNKNLCTSNMK